MTRTKVQIVGVVLVLLGTAAAAAAQTEELVRTIRMDPGVRFTLTNGSGEITVTGVEGDDLTIRATKRVAGRGAAAEDALSRVEIEIEERGDRVVVETDYPQHRRSFLQTLASLFSGGERVPFVAVDYLVTVPRGFELEAQSFSGDLRSDIPILVGGGDPTRQGPVFGGANRAIRGFVGPGGAHLGLTTVTGDMTISAGDTATGGASQD